MAISLEQVKEIFPEQWCLEISELAVQKARSLAANYANPMVSDRVFLNSLCLDVVLPTIKDIFDLKENSLDSKKITQEQEKVWQSLYGVAIDVPQLSSQFRLILMPTEDFDTEELRVKQEWLNDPNLAGDIYLAVQVNVQESWLRVWGYTSHQELHGQGSYDVSDRSYGLDRADLWMSLEAIPAIVNQKLPLRTPVIASSPVIVISRELAPIQSLSQKSLSQKSLSQKILDKIWQPWDELVGALNMNLEIVRQNRFQGHWGRKINLGMNIGDSSLALVISFQEDTNHKYAIQARIYPVDGQIYLPHNLELLILEPNGNVFKKVKSREVDNWIQIEFKGELHEEFQVKAQLGEVSVTEEVAISSFINSIPPSKVAAEVINSRGCIKIPMFPEPWTMGKDIAKNLGIDLFIGRNKIDRNELDGFWGRPIQVLSYDLILIFYLGPIENNSRLVKLRLYPKNKENCLPVGIKLLCRLSDSEPAYKEKVAKSGRAYIGISFRCPIGKEFFSEVELGDRFTQEFMI